MTVGSLSGDEEEQPEERKKVNGNGRKRSEAAHSGLPGIPSGYDEDGLTRVILVEAHRNSQHGWLHTAPHWLLAADLGGRMVRQRKLEKDSASGSKRPGVVILPSSWYRPSSPSPRSAGHLEQGHQFHSGDISNHNILTSYRVYAISDKHCNTGQLASDLPPALVTKAGGRSEASCPVEWSQAGGRSEAEAKP